MPCKKKRDKILASFPKPPPGMFVPQCREDGGYQPSQCHGSTGFCWCVDEYGNELTGTRVRGPLNCSGKLHILFKHFSIIKKQIEDINTKEIPDELSRENLISSM